MIYLRNAHAKQTVYLPIRAGWCRVLKPSVTTCVPAALLHTPVVRHLLLRKLVDVVDGAAWDADVRQRRASRTDMARAIAAAEQREFDKLRAGLPKQEQHRSSAERIERLRQRLAAGATLRELAAEHGTSRQAMDQLCRRHGLLEARHAPRGDRRPVLPPRAAKAL